MKVHSLYSNCQILSWKYTCEWIKSCGVFINETATGQQNKQKTHGKQHNLQQ